MAANEPPLAVPPFTWPDDNHAPTRPRRNGLQALRAAIVDLLTNNASQRLNHIHDMVDAQRAYLTSVQARHDQLRAALELLPDFEAHRQYLDETGTLIEDAWRRMDVLIREVDEIEALLEELLAVHAERALALGLVVLAAVFALGCRWLLIG